MCTVLTCRAALNLCVVEVGVHVGVRVQEPCIDEACDTARVHAVSLESPRERVVQYSVGHAVKVTDVVDQARVRVELAVLRDIGTRNPYYTIVRCKASDKEGCRLCSLCWGVSSVVFPTFEQSGHQLRCVFQSVVRRS